MKEKPKSLVAYDNHSRAKQYEQRKGFAPARKEKDA